MLIWVAILLIVGTTVYSLTEGWNAVDAFYFSVITLTTVGFGDFSPTTTVGKLFTSVDMNDSRTDQRFFNKLLLVVAIIAIVLIWPYTSSVVLAITFAVVLQPLHRFFYATQAIEWGLLRH